MANSIYKNINILLLFTSLLFLPIHSQAKAKRKKGSSSQKAVIKVEGAAVYKEPNFDSQVLDYLSLSKQVRISKKVYKGVGGFGLFYKIKLATRKYGYIVDTEIELSEKNYETLSESNPEVDNPAFNPIVEEDGDEDFAEPLIFKKYIGGGVGIVNYSEKLDGKTHSETLRVLGFKMNGPILSQLPLDIELLLSFTAPDYYKSFSDSSASGFILISNILLNLPLAEEKDSLFYYGLGPVITYSKLNVKLAGTSIDSQDSNLGLALSIGYLAKINQFGLRVEGKYHFEKSSYPSFTLSLQKELR